MPASTLPRLARLCLVLEASPLLDGIVQLAVAVGQLAAEDEQLESFGEERVVAIRPGQRGDLDGVTGDERGPDQRRLGGGLEQLLDDLSAAPRGVVRDAVLVGERANRVDGHRWMHLGADRLADEIDHAGPPPGLVEIHLLVADRHH